MTVPLGWGIAIVVAAVILTLLLVLIIYANLPTTITLGKQAADYNYLSEAPLTKIQSDHSVITVGSFSSHNMSFFSQRKLFSNSEAKSLVCPVLFELISSFFNVSALVDHIRVRVCMFGFCH